jgi:hypothetical protein
MKQQCLAASLVFRGRAKTHSLHDREKSRFEKQRIEMSLVG